ncbi:MAG TPA: DUF998 domain-containing protein [Terracidiphilus sp.]|nr:DUF998 domain-containing protein [Terracidiphilus sp.]
MPFTSAFVVLGLMTPGYDPLRDTISALELTPSSLGQRLNFFVFGRLICLFAMGLRRELQRGFGATLIPVFQFLASLGVIGDAKLATCVRTVWSVLLVSRLLAGARLAPG